MRQLRRFALTALFGVIALTGAPATLAVPCAGFVDVDTSSSFCPNVEWLKNRQITLGCAIPNAYCPNDAVTRLQMAAFMNRLGNALTPTQLRVDTAPRGSISMPISSWARRATSWSPITRGVRTSTWRSTGWRRRT